MEEVRVIGVDSTAAMIHPLADAIQCGLGGRNVRVVLFASSSNNSSPKRRKSGEAEKDGKRWAF